MLSNMACSLIEHKRIKTTLAKAKALRVYKEPLITKSKNDTTHSRRIVFSYLKQKEAITELFGDISSKVADRPGGYTRIIKLNNRLGDNAQMAFIELVDYNETYITDRPKKKKTRRRGGSKSVSTNPKSEVAGDEEVVNETPSIIEDSVIDVESTVDKVEEIKEEKSTEEKIEIESTEESQEEKKEEESTEEKIEMESTEESQEEKKEEENTEEKIEMESTEESQQKRTEAEKKDDSNDSVEEEKAD